MVACFNGLSVQHWRAELRPDGVLTLAFDRQGSQVNTFSQETLIELDALLERIMIDPPKALVIQSGKPGGFAAGADLTEFQDYDRKGQIGDVIHRGQQAFQRLAELPCPTVAAIHGFCMGGGTELALACRYRVASHAPSTRIGLPEVKLGIFPGWGGSARLPRLLGPAAALEIMLSGRALPAKAACEIGLVDRITTPEALLDVAVQVALNGVRRRFKQVFLGRAGNLWPVRQMLAPILKRQVARKVPKAHYPAPYALIECWRRSGGGSIETRLKAERSGVAMLAATQTARNLVRVFFLQERLKHQGNTAADRGGIDHVHVIGAGTMGGDIAAWAAYKGFTVSLHDRSPETLERARTRARALFDTRIKDEGLRAQAAARLQADEAGDGAAKADLVIEAIIEDPAAKRALYAELAPALKSTALLVSNTSSIPLDALKDGLDAPQRFAGLHYFNPVALMPLVEIVRHDALAFENAGRLAAFCKTLGKLPLIVEGTPGFLVNRLLFPYLLEAARAWADGIPAALIDRAAVEFGMPMGPIELIDTVGLDIAAGVAAELAPFLGLSVPATLSIPPEAGKRGKKDGQGMYVWKEGKPIKPEIPKGYQVPDDLQDRLILPLVNEAVAALHEGVAEDADLMDAGMIFGAGFAPFRGGPLRYLREIGRDVVLERLEALQARYGERFAPRPGWEDPALLRE